MRRVSLSTSQALFTFCFLVFSLILLNGYLQNLVADYRSDTWLVLVGVVAGLLVVICVARKCVFIQNDPLELAGFVIVVAGVWVYLVAPSLPTLLPPTQSMDAVRHYLHVLFSYPEGKLVSWYPAGGAYVAAMFAHWFGTLPLRVLHPTAASFIALSAGAVYGFACALLPKTRVSKIAALLAPALLFVPWSYFTGIIVWEQYFYAQAFAQFFVLAALWFISSYAENPHWLFAALIGAALLGVITAYPYLVALPLVLFALVVLARTRFFPLAGGGQGWGLVALVIFLALMIITAIALQRGGILELRAAQLAVVQGVGAGGVTEPSLETLGGPIFLLLALVGIPLAWRSGTFGRTILAFLLAWIVQLVALLVIQPFFQIAGYRVDKTFYILIFPLAILAALLPARVLERILPHIETSRRATIAAFVATVVLVGTGVLVLRPLKSYAPFTESELQAALWAKEHLDTYQISYLDPQPIRAYWLAFGLWRETLPNDWFQWIPAGTKLGPATFDEWLRDPAFPQWLLVRDVNTARTSSARIVRQNGNSAILQKDLPFVAAPAPSHAARWYFESVPDLVTLQLIGYDLPRTAFAPGETVTLTTYTESAYPPAATIGWRVMLETRDGTAVSKVEGEPFANKYPVQRWPPGMIARDTWTLPLAPDTPPGIYDVRVGLFRRAGGEYVDVYRLSAEGKRECFFTAPIATIKIPTAPPSADELRTATPIEARVGDNFLLSSYALQMDRAARRVRLTLYWQSITKTDSDYTVFVHLLDATGKIVAQSDAQPVHGAYPTSIWDPQGIVKDVYELAIPADARAPFSIAVGMYSFPDLKRLPVGTDDKVIFDLGF